MHNKSSSDLIQKYKVSPVTFIFIKYISIENILVLILDSISVKIIFLVFPIHSDYFSMIFQLFSITS